MIGLNQIGGAENVLKELVSLFPGAPVYTSMYAPNHMPAGYQQWPIHTSFMQYLPGVATHHQAYLPLYPSAFSQFDLSTYDLVLSNKSGFCHGIQAVKWQSASASRLLLFNAHTLSVDV